VEEKLCGDCDELTSVVFGGRFSVGSHSLMLNSFFDIITGILD